MDVLREHRVEAVRLPRARQEAEKLQLSLWLVVRCTVSRNARHVWGSEKHLYLDYAAWCRQASQTPGTLETFCRVMSEMFRWDGSGWYGVCLAEDWTASKASTGNADLC